MPYNEEQYLKASADLRTAVYTLAENDIDLEDIIEMVEQAHEDTK